MAGKHLRPFTGGQFALELDGVIVGMVQSIDGGHFKSEEVKYMSGQDNHLMTKFAGKPKYEDITLTVGMATAPDFWDWLVSTIKGDPERRDGAIVIYDFKRRERQRRTFYNALISEVGFPALDASSKAAALITVKISPERMHMEPPNKGDTLKIAYAQNESSKQKMWLASAFNFSLDRFKGDASLRNAKIEAFTIKQGIMMNPIGRYLNTQRFAGRVEKPSLQISIPQADLKGWSDWWDAAVRKGDYVGELTNGVITYLGPDLKEELMSINLENVGITSIEYDKLEAHKEGISKAKISLFVEHLHLVPGDGNASS